MDQPLRLSRGLGDSEARSETDITRLLAMLAMAPEAQPPLLRALRHLLSTEHQDVGWEIAAWNHPDVLHCLPDCTLRKEARPRHQKQFLRDLASAGTWEWPYRALDVITRQLTEKPAYLYDQARALERAAKRQADEVGGYLVETLKDLRDMPEGDEREQRLRWVMDLLASTDVRLIRANEKLEALHDMKNRELRRRGQASGPPNKQFDFIFRQQPEQLYLLWQQGVGWGVTPAAQGIPASGSPLGNLGSRSRVFELEPAGDVNEQDGFWAGGVEPDWASAWGEDEFGRWAEFRIQDKAGRPVTQRLRWIEPGTFQMGSPQDEAQRESNEDPHQVTLTEGYWLADTACTQALWEAVMGENPSGFKGAERPVEQVSWEQVGAFIDRLNAQVEDLNHRLPSEAEWEYACRAGTLTPFWFGENISTDQVNYDGDYPYAGGKKGERRGQTVEVKALPCNGWGLYQMHGNVWEWCSDWYGEYLNESVKDPQGPESGGWRVLRGGGWLCDGEGARSARRDAGTPDYRYRSVGFRLARGQSSQQAGDQVVRGTGQAARSNDGSGPRKAWSRLKGFFKNP